MRHAGLSRFGRLATWMATWGTPPYYGRRYLAQLNPIGYISPQASISHPDLRLGAHVFIGDRVTIFGQCDGSPVEIGEGVHLYGDTYIQTGEGGHISIGHDTQVQVRCQLSGYQAAIRIGARVQIASNCSFYPYDHDISLGERITGRGLTSKGDIVIDDDVWIGTGVIVLSGVTIGRGAVIGAGSVVITSVPANAVAVGVPARVVRLRHKGPDSPPAERVYGPSRVD
jgi:acetyltransferase-like isoleucine patch superfamily enzyme